VATDETDFDDVTPSPYLHRRPFLLRTSHRVCKLTGGPHEFAVFVALLAAYVIGAAIAYSEGLLGQYLDWYILVAILFAMGWVTGWLEWGRKLYTGLLWKWRNNFDERYLPLARKHLETALGDGHSVWIIVPALILGEGEVLSVRLSGGTVLQVPPVSRWIVFGPLPIFIFLMIVLTAAGVIAGVAVSAVLEHVVFMHRLAKLPLDPFRLLSADTYLGELAKFGFAASMSWFVGVAVAGIILYGDLNAVTIPLYGLAAVVGLVLFFLPQIYINRMIVRSKKRLKMRLRRLLPKDWEKPDRLTADPRIPHTLELIQHADGVKDWPIDVPVIFSELMAALIPFGATFLTQVAGLKVT